MSRDVDAAKALLAEAGHPDGIDVEIACNNNEPWQINAIQALECNCASIDRLGEIRAELMAILPDTQIIETESTALARAEARNTAKATAKQTMAETERVAGLIFPIVTVAGMAWIGLLALGNVRERVSEIGILRAMGVRGRKIFTAFLSRAALAGFGGALAGLAGWMALMGSVWWIYGIGLKGDDASWQQVPGRTVIQEVDLLYQAGVVDEPLGIDASADPADATA